VRLDSTSVSLYHDPEGSQLIRRGHSKDHRPDLAQLKVMLATLDPLGAPLVTQVVAGNRADDGLYLPAVDEARAVLGQTGLLYIGDSKMEALNTRAHIVAGGDYYLTPLSVKGSHAELLAELVQSALAGEPDLIARSGRKPTNLSGRIPTISWMCAGFVSVVLKPALVRQNDGTLTLTPEKRTKIRVLLAIHNRELKTAFFWRCPTGPRSKL
jgi:hypothetical protein